MANKKILITGGNGFIGSHLFTKLLSTECEIINLSRSSGSYQNKRITTLVGDITDWEFVKNVFEKYEINTCFHLASLALVEKGVVSPRETLKNNIEGSWNILEAVRNYQVNKLIIFSTAQVYGDNSQVPYKEYFTPRPSRIYETSKTCSDIIAQSYAHAYNVPVLIARFTNIYGPGDHNYSRIIPKTINSILLNKNPIMWGGSAKRDYLYIDDVIDACMCLFNLDSQKMKNRIFNFGGDNIISVKDLINKILLLSNASHLVIDHINSIRNDEISVQYVSSKKAEKLLNWKAKTSLDIGLWKTINWYREQYR